MWILPASIVVDVFRSNLKLNKFPKIMFAIGTSSFKACQISWDSLTKMYFVFDRSNRKISSQDFFTSHSHSTSLNWNDAFQVNRLSCLRRQKQKLFFSKTFFSESHWRKHVLYSLTSSLNQSYSFHNFKKLKLAFLMNFSFTILLVYFHLRILLDTM